MVCVYKYHVSHYPVVPIPRVGRDRRLTERKRGHLTTVAGKVAGSGDSSPRDVEEKKRQPRLRLLAAAIPRPCASSPRNAPLRPAEKPKLRRTVPKKKRFVDSVGVVSTPLSSFLGVLRSLRAINTDTESLATRGKKGTRKEPLLGQKREREREAERK